MASSAPAPRSWVLWAVAVAGLAVLTAVLILGLASARLDQPALRVFLIGWIVVPYTIAGGLAWWRRPRSRLGPLMLLVGLSMALTPLQWSSQPGLYSLGHLLDMLPAALFLHVFLAFPTGRLTRRPERLTVMACYLVTVGLQLIKITLGVNPDSLFSVVDEPAAGNLVEAIQLLLVAACLLTGVFLLHRRRPQPGSRRPTVLVVDVFGFALIMLALLYLAGLFSWPFVEVLRLTTFAALGLAPLAFLFALLDLRLAHSDVTGLLVELQADPTAELQAPLARALRDPTLQLYYWLPEFGTWADQDGQPAHEPVNETNRSIRILHRDRDGEPLAALRFDASVEDEHELLDAVLATAAIALENGRLRAELRARLQDLQGSRIRVLEAGLRERQRLERDLHDGAQVRLVSLALELGLLGADPATDPVLRSRLQEARATVSASLEDLRDVARGIYPAVLTGHGLRVALESLTARATLPVGLDVDLPWRPPESVEVAAYYIVSEALANIGKHSSAATATVHVRQADDALTVDVSDDGHGVPDLRYGSGLHGLTDRVEALGGHLEAAAIAPHGVRVHAEIPCPSHH